MPVKLERHAAEEGTYHIVATFEDEDGTDLAPTTVNWTLSDMSGNIINARDDVSKSSPATSTTITLAGTDLTIVSGQTSERKFLIKWVYNSSYGNGLTDYEEAVFIIDDLKKVP